MSLLTDLTMLGRFAWRLHGFLDPILTTEEAKNIIRRRMAERGKNFLHVVKKAIFEHPHSPYLYLMRAAGCEMDDLETMVRQKGIEETLRTLREKGIYVSFEEFKGLKPALRGSQTFQFQDSDFDNPLLTSHVSSSSGGTRGKPSRVRINFEHINQTAPCWALWFAVHGWANNPVVFWTQVYAGVAIAQLRYAKLGIPFIRWFSAGEGGTLKDRFMAASIHGLIRKMVHFPKPEAVPFTEARRINDYLINLVRSGIHPCINLSPSAAMRLSLEAQNLNLSLKNISFLLRGEPLTEVRREVIERSGGKAVQTYGFSEGGPVGSQCPHPSMADDIHIFLDAYAVIQHPLLLEEGLTVDALLITGLMDAVPKIMLNTEIGDYGVLEKRRCGCLFDEFGYDQHLHTIRSFQKITGEGVTFLGSDLFPIIEEVLPRRFGGDMTDYQLIEEQGCGDLPQYYLLVSPKVGAIDEESLVALFLEELSKKKGSYRLMTHLWKQAGTVRVKRQFPLPTRRGKILPFLAIKPNHPMN